MLQRRQNPGFALKAGQTFRILGQLRRQDFQRHQPIQSRLAGLVHRPHPALAQEFQNLKLRKKAAELLGMKGSTFPAKKAMQQSRKLGTERLVRAIELLATADMALRGTVDWPPELVMEVLVARLSKLGGRR